MTCQEFWKLMPELKGSVEHEHSRECAACAALLARQKELRQGLDRLAQDFRTQEAPHRVETKLLHAFREHRQEAPAPRRHKPLAWALAAAAVIGLVFFAALQRHSATRPPFHSDTVADVMQAEEAEEFWPLPNAPNGVSAEDLDLITVEVPTSTLAAMGVPVSDDGPARVQAVLALDADGVVQGVRLLQ